MSWARKRRHKQVMIKQWFPSDLQLNMTPFIRSDSEWNGSADLPHGMGAVRRRWVKVTGQLIIKTMNTITLLKLALICLLGI